MLVSQHLFRFRVKSSSHVVSSTSIFELGDWYFVLVSQHLFWFRVQHVVAIDFNFALSWEDGILR